MIPIASCALDLLVERRLDQETKTTENLNLHGNALQR